MNSELLQKMQDQIDALTARLDGYEKSSTLPSDLEWALRERLGLSIGVALNATGTGAAGNTTVNNAFPVIVPANPSGVLTVTYNNVTYNLLYR